MSPYHRGGVSLGTRVTWPPSPGPTDQTPGERCVCTPALVLTEGWPGNKALRGGSCPVAAEEGSWRTGGLPAREQQPPAKAPVGASAAWPGQVRGGCRMCWGDARGRQEIGPQGRTFLPSRLVWGTGPATPSSRSRWWWWNPPPISTASTKETGPSPAPRDPGTRGVSAAGAARREGAKRPCA